MAHGYFCPECGASLDPGERCTCPGYVVKAMTAKEKAVAAATVTANAKSPKRTNNVKRSISQAARKVKHGNEGYKSCKDEDAEQMLLIEWCDAMSGRYPELALLYHIPNEGKRSIAYAVRMKRMGLKSGVPDLCLPVARGKYHGMYIEMKANDNVPTIGQNQWLCKLRVQGYKCIVAWSFDYARDAIMAYLELENKENEDVIL